jgi:hypothetical protein
MIMMIILIVDLEKQIDPWLYNAKFMDYHDIEICIKKI